MKISISIFFLGAVIGLQYASTCLGSEGKPASPIISLKVDNEPLRSVLEKISNISGYGFTIQGVLTERQINMVLEDVSLEEALSRLLWNLNHVIVWRQGEKKIIVFIINERGSPSESRIRDNFFPAEDNLRKNQRNLPGKTPGTMPGHTLDMTSKRTQSPAGLKPSISGRDMSFVQGTRTIVD